MTLTIRDRVSAHQCAEATAGAVIAIKANAAELDQPPGLARFAPAGHRGPPCRAPTNPPRDTPPADDCRRIPFTPPSVARGA